MPPKSPSASGPVRLVCGEDDYAVKQRAKSVYQAWCDELGGMDHEIVDATANNSSDALKSIARLRMALQTLPFFGTGKAIWLQNCNYLGDDRTASTKAVTETLAELAGELKAFRFDTVRLLISAGKVDKRKTFYKTVEKLGQVEILDGLSLDDRDWQIKAEAIVEQSIAANQKAISHDALAMLVSFVGPNSRQLASETEKLILYVGASARITVEDVEAIVSRNKQSRAFALGDALGERNLPKLLKNLDQELWALKLDSKKSEIGLLYGVINKVRTMLLVKELIRDGLLKPAASSQAVQAQIARIPPDRLPQDRAYNPTTQHPFVVMKAMDHSKNYSTEELIRAMDLLLQCNRDLVSSGSDEALLLQKALIEIVNRPGTSAGRAPSPPLDVAGIRPDIGSKIRITR